MGFIRIDCNDYNELQEHIKKLSKEYAGYRVYALFTGSILPETKQSWCPDCATAEPVIWETLMRISEEPFNIAFIKCRVGFSDAWKDPNNFFRTDEKLKITSIPTLLKLNNIEKRLVKDEDFISSDSILHYLKTS